MDRKLIELSLEYKYLYIDNNVLKSEIFINDLIDYLKSNLNNLIVNNKLSTSTNVKFGKLTYEQIFNKVES